MGRKAVMSKYESTISGAVSDAFSTLSELGEECREVVDNAPESLQNSPRNETLGETADALESLSEPDTPKCIGDLPITFTYKPQRRMSRSDRRYEAVRILEAAKDAAQAWLDDEENAESTADSEEVDAFIGEIEEIVSEAENVEFPGMFG
jgi:hypothetical protein